MKRTWIGAAARATIMLVIQTARQRAIEPFTRLQTALTQTQPTLAQRYEPEDKTG